MSARAIIASSAASMISSNYRYLVGFDLRKQLNVTVTVSSKLHELHLYVFCSTYGWDRDEVDTLVQTEADIVVIAFSKCAGKRNLSIGMFTLLCLTIITVVFNFEATNSFCSIFFLQRELIFIINQYLVVASTSSRCQAHQQRSMRLWVLMPCFVATRIRSQFCMSTLASPLIIPQYSFWTFSIRRKSQLFYQRFLLLHV